MYHVKEIFFSIQGEGHHSGQAAIFCRFSGCNLWNGLEKDRSDAICNFCDTDFVGTNGQNGGSYTADQLAKKINALWPKDSHLSPVIILTGGEPMLQVDEHLIDALKGIHAYICIETNGTYPVPSSIDWITVSPKEKTVLKQTSGNELKLVFPQASYQPEELLSETSFAHYYLQPMDGPNREENTKKVLNYCLQHPIWKISVQLHKYLGVE